MLNLLEGVDFDDPVSMSPPPRSLLEFTTKKYVPENKASHLADQIIPPDNFEFHIVLMPLEVDKVITESQKFLLLRNI